MESFPDLGLIGHLQTLKEAAFNWTSTRSSTRRTKSSRARTFDEDANAACEILKSELRQVTDGSFFPDLTLNGSLATTANKHQRTRKKLRSTSRSTRTPTRHAKFSRASSNSLWRSSPSLGSLATTAKQHQLTLQQAISWTFDEEVKAVIGTYVPVELSIRTAC